ncbi:DEAD/DEAH box helicase [Psychrosphaera algicola]|uniref:Helicase-related protein n=1 Tax=Psychrosphaera algicola TaxID=3023714 RepID=A0ABT5FGZ1_9GAMM|nr:helicase-related protein [Psychrosphaera sp. G1-22]MDC2890362.1 helicase-related protein [Psychrosphaera sp. G1-22]
MASEVAYRLFEDELIDLVLCFSPSLSVAHGIKETFSRRLNCHFNGEIGAIGKSLTYQAIQYLDNSFWQTIRKYRVLVIFDEIHHCSGSSQEVANAWGQQILVKIQGLAKYTLALSGTPWRSDALPIVMAEYTDPEGQLVCDYQYTLAQAVNDGVCRSPKIVLIDNEKLTIATDEGDKSYPSILELLKSSNISYRNVIFNNQAVEYLVRLACDKLSEIRKESPNAGGLVVAASVEHAKSLCNLLRNKFNQKATIVTYKHDDALAEINRFKNGVTEWIVSVGMISEGTDIPRLQVCCHMSSVKTELYFRQVLGRILRVNNSPNQEALVIYVRRRKPSFNSRSNGTRYP